MRKILYVTSGLRVGGAEMMLLQLAAHLQRRGHLQHVVSLSGRGALAPAFESHGVPVTDFSLASPLAALSILLRIRRLVTRMSPDVVQGWMYHGNLAALFAHVPASRSCGRRLFWGLRASDMDSSRYGRIIAWNARFSRVPDMIIANSKAGRDFHIARGFRPRRIEIVPNGIDTDKFRPDAAARAALRTAYNIAPDALLVIHVARADRMKDHATFLAVMRTLPQLAAILIGAETENLPLPPNVRALGMRADVERLYPAADIVVSSSAYGEGFSNAIAEGMSAGLVPIATDVGDARLIIGNTGSVVPPSDFAALSAALAAEAQITASERGARGAAARQRIVSHYAIEQAIDAYEQIYAAAGEMAAEQRPGT
jgi:glycosyltransferase involved in cell wall biosynthesis